MITNRLSSSDNREEDSAQPSDGMKGPEAVCGFAENNTYTIDRDTVLVYGYLSSSPWDRRAVILRGVASGNPTPKLSGFMWAVRNERWGPHSIHRHRSGRWR